MLRRIGSILGLILAVAAFYLLRKVQRWGLVQDAVSHLPGWLIAAGAVILLAAWALYVLPERVAIRLGRLAHLKQGIPAAWLGWASWLAAPLAVYYLTHVHSNALTLAYGGVFLLCLFALMAKELSKVRSKGRRH